MFQEGKDVIWEIECRLSFRRRIGKIGNFCGKDKNAGTSIGLIFFILFNSIICRGMPEGVKFKS